MKDYLRNRPFLTVEITYQPAEGVNTGKKGWMNDPKSVRTMERVSFLDRINNETKYAVIIDIINSTVIRNKSTRRDDDLIANYLSKYREETKAALSEWARREADRMRANG